MTGRKAKDQAAGKKTKRQAGKAATEKKRRTRAKPGLAPRVEPTVQPAFVSESEQAAAENGRGEEDLRELLVKAQEVHGRLTPLEFAFIREYLVSRNASAAARAAGYSESFAHAKAGQLLNKPRIRAIVQEIDGYNLAALAISPHFIMERLKIEALTAFEGSARINALRTLAELHSMFPPKQIKHDATDQVLKALQAELSRFDGAGTGLPPPRQDPDGQHA